MSDAFEPDNPASADSPISDAAVTTPHEGHEPAEEGLQALMAELHHRIAVAAYFLAERRGFAPGHELDDWLAAEDAIEEEDAARWSED
jgi:hypothetical protein